VLHFNTAVARLNSAKDRLELRGQAAAIAVRDYNEQSEYVAQLKSELEEYKAEIERLKAEKQRVEDQLQQQIDLTTAAEQRGDAQQQEVVFLLGKLQELQGKLVALEELRDDFAAAIGKADSKIEQFKRQKTGGYRQQQQQHQQQGAAGSSGTGGSSAGGSPGGSSAGQGGPSKPGWAPRRSGEIFQFLQKKKMCARCFGKQHDFKACTAPVKGVNAVPEGYPESG
jgi:hypothetical protein